MSYREPQDRAQEQFWLDILRALQIEFDDYLNSILPALQGDSDMLNDFWYAHDHVLEALRFLRLFADDLNSTAMRYVEILLHGYAGYARCLRYWLDVVARPDLLPYLDAADHVVSRLRGYVANACGQMSHADVEA